MATTETTCARIQLSSRQRPSINAHAYADARDRRLNLPHATNHNPADPYHLVDHWILLIHLLLSHREQAKGGWCCSRRRTRLMCVSASSNQSMFAFLDVADQVAAELAQPKENAYDKGLLDGGGERLVIIRDGSSPPRLLVESEEAGKDNPISIVDFRDAGRSFSFLSFSSVFPYFLEYSNIRVCCYHALQSNYSVYLDTVFCGSWAS